MINNFYIRTYTLGEIHDERLKTKEKIKNKKVMIPIRKLQKYTRISN